MRALTTRGTPAVRAASRTADRRSAISLGVDQAAAADVVGVLEVATHRARRQQPIDQLVGR